MGTVRWWGLVGAVGSPMSGTPDLTPHDKTRRLAEATVLGPLTMRPGDKLLVEYVRLDPMDLSGYGQIESHPIIVEGEDPEPRWQQPAASKVVAAARLLALLWAEPWVVRTAPIDVRGRKPEVPDSWSSPAPDPLLDDGPDAPALIAEDPEHNKPSTLPPWLSAAWWKQDHHSYLAQALAAWHEGLQLQMLHPSMAMVAYVGAIEIIGRQLGTRRTTGAAFKAALEAAEVASIPGALADRLYARRSNTAHEGRLHGVENYLGTIIWPHPPTRDKVVNFMFDELITCGQAARQVLLYALGAPAGAV